MNNLLVRDVKYLDEQYRIGKGIISDDAFKQLEKLFIPVDPKPDYFNQKNNIPLPKLAKENYKKFLGSLLTKTRLSIQPNLLKKFFGEFTGNVGWKIDPKFGEILFQKKISILIMSYMKVQLMAIQN